MALKSGMSTQWGFKTETTPGVPVVVDKFLPIVSETLERVDERLESAGIIAGRRMRTSNQWAPGQTRVAGGIQSELYTKDITVLLEHMFGDATSPFTPGDRSGKSLTIQIGKPDIAGTVNPFTYSGCKFTSWELACQVGQIATLGLDVDAMNEILYRTVADGATNTNTTVTSVTAAFTADDIGKPISGGTIPANATITAVASATSVTISQAASGTGTGITLVIGVALAAASYTAGSNPVSFAAGAVTIAGTAVKVKGAKLSGGVGLDVDRYFLGQRTHDEALENDLMTVGVELDVEFADLTQYRRYCNGTEHAVVLTFTAATGFSLAITTNVRFDGKSPTVGGREVVQQNLPMVCVASGADSTAISVALTESS